MKKQNIIIIILILIIILLIATGIVFFTTNNIKTENIVPDTTKYSYIVQKTLILDTEGNEVSRREYLYIFDDKDVYVSMILRVTYSKEEYYLGEKQYYEEDVTLFDDDNYIITKFFKFEYNEKDTKDEIIKLVEQQESINDEYLITTHKVY